MLLRFGVPLRFQTCKTFFVFLALILSASLQVIAESGCSKSDLERALVGKTVVSRVQIGGKAIRTMCDQGCPSSSVDTLLFPDGQISYRANWLYEVQPPADSFSAGTKFTIMKIAIKRPDWAYEPDGLELRLKDEASKSADVRVLIGPSLINDCNLEDVEAAVSGFFQFQEQLPTPEQRASTGT